MAKPLKFSLRKRFDLLHGVLFAVIIGFSGYALLNILRAAPPPPTVYLEPITQRLAANQPFTVEVWEDSGTTGVNAVQAYFTYPQTLLDFVSIDMTPGVFKTVPEAVGGNGTIRIGAATQGGETPFTGKRLVARVNFRTKTVSGNATLTFTSETILLRASDSTDILGSVSRTEGSTITIDVTSPTVSLTSPSNGAVVGRVSSNQVVVTAAATDSSGVARVDITLNGTLLTSLTTSPYTHTINSTSLSLGSNTFQAKAVDSVGNEASTANVTISIVDVTAPTVTITQPAGGSTLSGAVNIQANASDEAGGSGVSRVEFLVNGALINTDTAAPYSFSWPTTSVTDGQYSLTARAYDFATPANSTLSSSVSVTVDNSDKQPPTVPANLRMTARTTRTLSIAWNASTDNVGVTGYRISRNGAVVHTTTSLAFTDTNLTPGTSYTYNVVAFDARNNASSASASLTVRTIRLGDVSGDDVVSLLDLTLLLSYYGATSQSTNWASAKSADFSNDDRVSLLDLSLLLSNYGL